MGVVIATDEPFCILTAKWVAEQGRKKLFQRKPAGGAKGGRPGGKPPLLPHPGLAALTSILQAGYFPAEAGGHGDAQRPGRGESLRAIGLRLSDLSNQTASFVDQRAQVPHSRVVVF